MVLHFMELLSAKIRNIIDYILDGVFSAFLR